MEALGRTFTIAVCFAVLSALAAPADAQPSKSHPKPGDVGCLDDPDCAQQCISSADCQPEGGNDPNRAVHNDSQILRRQKQICAEQCNKNYSTPQARSKCAKSMCGIDD